MLSRAGGERGYHSQLQLTPTDLHSDLSVAPLSFSLKLLTFYSTATTGYGYEELDQRSRQARAADWRGMVHAQVLLEFAKRSRLTLPFPQNRPRHGAELFLFLLWWLPLSSFWLIAVVGRCGPSQLKPPRPPTPYYHRA